MSKKVSIVIPVYNAEKTIRRCVESLAKGSYGDIEIILSDDASKDGSWAKCQELEQEYPCVTAIRNEKNSGVSHTRNQALDRISGELLMFVDSDDWTEPDYVEQFAHAWDDAVKSGTEPVLVISSFVNHDEVHNHATDIFSTESVAQGPIITLAPYLDALYHNRLLQQLWNKMFQAETVKRNKISFDEALSMGEDFRFILNYLQAVGGGKEAVLIQKPLYHYIRDSGHSLMSGLGHQAIEEPLRDIRILYQIIGLEPEASELKYSEEKEKLLEYYAYSIMHNGQLDSREKKKMISDLDSELGKGLYKRHKRILFLEKWRN